MCRRACDTLAHICARAVLNMFRSGESGVQGQAHRFGVATDGRSFPRGVGSGRVGLVQCGLALAVKPHHKGGYAEGAHAAALRVLLLDVGDPPRQVVHLATGVTSSIFHKTYTFSQRKKHSCTSCSGMPMAATAKRCTADQKDHRTFAHNYMV